MGVAEGGVSDQQRLLLHCPSSKFLRADLLEFIAGSFRNGLLGVVKGDDARQAHVGTWAPFDLIVTVDDNISEISEELGGAELSFAQLKELGAIVDEAGGRLAADEIGMSDDVVEKRNIGFDPADAKFVEGSFHALEREGECRRKGSNLDQHGVIEGGDDCSGVAHGSVEANAQAGRRTISDYFAVIRGEVGRRIFGGDAALDSKPIARDIVLVGNGNGVAMNGLALGDEYLRADNVDARDHLSHGVFDLDPGIHFDEEPFIGIHIDEEFHGASVLITDLAAQLDGSFTELTHDLWIEIDGRGDFDDFLVSSLNGAISLMEVHNIAVFVAEDLHFDVFGASDKAFEENGGVAKSDAGFVLGFLQEWEQLGLITDHSHAASTPTEGGFDDERKADVFGKLFGEGGIGDRILGAWNGGNADLFGDEAGGGLVAHHFEVLDTGADKGDASVGAGAGKGGVFRKETVAGMDIVDASFFCDVDDAWDVEVGGDRAFARVDEVSFVGFEAMDAEAIFLGVDCYSAQAELGSGTEDANSDFSAVGDKEFFWCGHGMGV